MKQLQCENRVKSGTTSKEQLGQGQGGLIQRSNESCELERPEPEVVERYKRCVWNFKNVQERHVIHLLINLIINYLITCNCIINYFINL